MRFYILVMNEYYYLDQGVTIQVQKIQKFNIQVFEIGGKYIS